MSRWLEVNYICDSRIFWDASNFEIQLQDAFQSGNQRSRSNFFPQLRKIQWCEALSYFSLGGAQNDSGRFQRESVFGHAIFRNLKELQMANEAVKYYASEALAELCFQKVWAKMDGEMARGKLYLWFSDILRCVKFQNPVAGCIPECKSEVQKQFFPELRSGLVGVGPRYALFFYLLRCRWSVRFVEWCAASGDNMLNAELISHHILSQCCSWRLQLERCFSSAVVEKLMSSFKLIRILLLQWLFAHCFSGAADLGWGRVLRSPPPLLLWKGSATSS